MVANLPLKQKVCFYEIFHKLKCAVPHKQIHKSSHRSIVFWANKGPGHSGAGLTGPEPFWVPKG